MGVVSMVVVVVVKGHYLSLAGRRLSKDCLTQHQLYGDSRRLASAPPSNIALDSLFPNKLICQDATWLVAYV